MGRTTGRGEGPRHVDKPEPPAKSTHSWPAPRAPPSAAQPWSPLFLFAPPFAPMPASASATAEGLALPWCMALEKRSTGPRSTASPSLLPSCMGGRRAASEGVRGTEVPGFGRGTHATKGCLTAKHPAQVQEHMVPRAHMGACTRANAREGGRDGKRDVQRAPDNRA
jgi:hypothetical protein